MNRTTPQMQSIALRLINYEMPGNDSAATANTANFQETERLRPHLATLMGNGGFRALLARALALASAEVSWLRTVQVNADDWRRPTPVSSRLNFAKGRSFCWPSCWNCWWPSSARL
jgi:hypothetical protein